MHKGKVFSLPNYRMQPFTVDLQEKGQMILEGVYRIFSNNEVVKYNLNRFLPSMEVAMERLLTTLEGYQSGQYYDYFLIDNINNRLAGTVHLLSPEFVKKSYPLLNYFIDKNKSSSYTWAIEYYLDPLYWNKGIMSYFVNEVTEELIIQGAENVCAIVSVNNLPSISLLKKTFFEPIYEYKDTQGQVLWNRK